MILKRMFFCFVLLVWEVGEFEFAAGMVEKCLPCYIYIPLQQYDVQGADGYERGGVPDVSLHHS